MLIRRGFRLVLMGIPGFKVFKKAVKGRVKPGDHANLALSPRSAEQIPLKESANRADRSARKRRPDFLVFNQPRGVAIELTKHFMQGVEGIVAHESR